MVYREVPLQKNGLIRKFALYKNLSSRNKFILHRERKIAKQKTGLPPSKNLDLSIFYKGLNHFFCIYIYSSGYTKEKSKILVRLNGGKH